MPHVAGAFGRSIGGGAGAGAAAHAGGDEDHVRAVQVIAWISSIASSSAAFMPTSG
jgi:hypothetical protein